MANKVTIMDVAKRVGVSKSTASDALNFRRSTSAATREKVLEAAKSMGYKPNYAAQSLSTKKTMMIGVLVYGLRDLHTAVLVECFADELAKYSYEMLLMIAQNKRELAFDYISKLSSGMADGIINLLPALTAAEARTAARGVPIITYLRREPQCPTYMDYVPGTMEALNHLWSQGHRRIGFLAEREAAKDIGEDGRILGYKQFLSQKGSLDENMIVYTEMHNSFYEICAKIETLYNRGATAIFTFNDAKALIAIQWAHQKGIRIPEDLSILGFNDSPEASTAVPALTTVQMPIRPIVSATIEALIAAIEMRPAPQQQIIVPHLIIRESTAKPKEVS